MAPIYVKTVYSFLSSTITIDDLITLAKKNNYQELCICDDNMYGVMEFITKCNSNNIKPIVGVDIKQPINMYGLITMTYINSYTNYIGYSKTNT